MPLQAITSSEPIPGYRVRERIGAGGYGEVWKADAPGGLVKAIKFVYGRLDEDRASRELKALNRIKSVRHPFLLSLERIEVVDGQLLIVTELAEASLKERFDQCCEQGLPGIPREELLQYLRDAADVLDYMSEQYSLQHLDVKPENLLILAGRVKVADFGLVKDLHEVTASLMGGLTPLYAPPEVFDGRPSRWSDQYSLAIVFQEMLTGELPFPGTSAVQLARQHLNARPRLSALSENDQAIIARSLAKIPEQRFPSCRALLEQLDASEISEGTGNVPAPGGNLGTRDVSQTEVFDEVPRNHVWLTDSTSPSVPRIDPSPELSSLPPINSLDATVAMRPTLFLAVGRTGGRILLGLRRRLEDRLGDLSRVPAIQCLLLDTDGKDLLHSSRQQTHGNLASHEMLGLPLRRPQDYRKDSSELLSWLSRRWLYNIPRSLQTDGLRPLGRLAMVDHIEEIRDRIVQAVQDAVRPETLRQSQDATGLEFAEKRMRIVLVSSISGGTGSGMVVDLGYLARDVLARLDLPDDDLCGVLTHSTGRTPRWKELAVVNAYSTLGELNHYGRLGSSYPGDKACDIPPRNGNSFAFRDTYLVHLGDNLSDHDYDVATDKVAEYIFLDAATSAGAFFRECRDLEPRTAETRNAEIRLRTFGLHQLSCLQDDIIAVTVEHLCQNVVQRWLRGEHAVCKAKLVDDQRSTRSESASKTERSDSSHLMPLAEQWIDSLDFDVEQLVQEVFQSVETELGGSADTYLRDQLNDMVGKQNLESPQAVIEITSRWKGFLDEMLGPSEGDENCSRGHHGSLESALAPSRQKIAFRHADAIRQWLLSQVDDPVVRIRGAKWLTQRMGNYCKSLNDRVKTLRQSVNDQSQQLQRAIAAASAPQTRGKDRREGDNVGALLQQFGRLRLYTSAVESVFRIVQTVEGQIAGVQDELLDLGRKLRQLADHFDTSQPLSVCQEAEPRDAEGQLQQAVAEILIQRIDELTEQLGLRLDEDVLAETEGLYNLLTQAGPGVNRLPVRLRAVARTTIISVIKHLDVA